MSVITKTAAKSNLTLPGGPSSKVATFDPNAGTATQAIFQPKTTTITDTTQSSQPDIIASLNGVMQSGFGRLATPEEVQKYGSELLAYQKSNPTTGTQNLKYDVTGKPLTGTNQMTSTSTDPQSFFASLLQGTAEASQYRIMGTYLDALKNMADSSKGSFNG